MPEHTCTVCSPHPDDAAFSLSMWMASWVWYGWNVQLVTCYTRSDYAPNLQSTNRRYITAVRRREDMSFIDWLKRMSQNVDIGCERLGRLDAPLRIGCNASAVCGAIDSRKDAELQELRSDLYAAFRPGLVFVPMALGHHVDHVLTRDACLPMAHSFKLAFYEDLPYAGVCGEKEIAHRAAELGRVLRKELKPVIHRRPDWRHLKQQAAHLYRSQITQPDLEVILAHAERHGGGERIWTHTSLPESSRILGTQPWHW